MPRARPSPGNRGSRTRTAARRARSAPAQVHERLPLTFAPLTPARWDDIAALFGERGACGGCWCMLWRTRRVDFDAGKGRSNRNAFHRLVQAGGTPGVIAYSGNTPIGWCAVAPREQYSALARSRVLAPVDDTPVWSISCLFVERGHRRSGVSSRLLKAAVDHARAGGAAIVEGYPVEPRTGSVPDAFAWTGLAASFRRAGFSEVARRSATRPIMRIDTRMRGKRGGAAGIRAAD
jgi:GNAT superfamily N-acetyltransferase